MQRDKYNVHTLVILDILNDLQGYNIFINRLICERAHKNNSWGIGIKI